MTVIKVFEDTFRVNLSNFKTLKLNENDRNGYVWVECDGELNLDLGTNEDGNVEFRSRQERAWERIKNSSYITEESFY